MNVIISKLFKRQTGKLISFVVFATFCPASRPCKCRDSDVSNLDGADETLYIRSDERGYRYFVWRNLKIYSAAQLFFFFYIPSLGVARIDCLQFSKIIVRAILTTWYACTWGDHFYGSISGRVILNHSYMQVKCQIYPLYQQHSLIHSYSQQPATPNNEDSITTTITTTNSTTNQLLLKFYFQH